MALAAFAADLDERRLVWAHYVGWTIPTEVSLPPARHYEFPVHERGEEPFKDEINRALAAGIDGFFVDVSILTKWRPGFYFNVEALLKASEGTPFMVAPCLDLKTTVSNQIDQIVWMMKRFGDHPNYPKIRGKYVLATYTYHIWTPDEWRQMLDGCAAAGCPIYLVGNVKPSCGVLLPKRLEEYKDVFDVCYSFAYTGREQLTVAEENRGVGEWCKANGKLFMPCIHPGYIGGWMSWNNATYIPFEGNGKFIRDLSSALERGEWLHLTSWNDNVETTLQPMASTPGYRRLLRAATDEFKRLPASAESADVLFAYHREELPGTLIRIEALRLPSKEKGALAVSGRLTGDGGRTVAKLKAQKLSKPWQRVEWLVPSGGFADESEIEPVFEMVSASRKVSAAFPHLSIRTPWIENQVTVRATFADMAKVDSALEIRRKGKSALEATLKFKSPAKVRRAILYRNDRPAGQFGAKGGDLSGIPLLFRGACRFELKCDGKSRIALAMRKSGKIGYDGFYWDNSKIVNRPHVTYEDRISAWVEGEEDAALEFSSDEGGTVAVKLSELAAKRRFPLRNGTLELSAFPDCTLREMPTLGLSEGELRLRLFDRAPYSGDVYFVRFELENSTIAESVRIRPFAGEKELVEMPILETPITIETYPGRLGLPQIVPNVVYNEFLTPDGELPIKNTSVVRRKVAAGALRREYWAFEGSGKSAVSDRWADVSKAEFGEGPGGRKALKFDGASGRSVRLPIRMWPMDSATVEFDIAPEPPDGKPRTIIRRDGWGAAFTVRQLGDGRLEAVWSGVGCGGVWDVKCAEKFTVAGSTPVRPGRWTRVKLVNDHAKIRLYVDGRPDGETAVRPFRVYGPSTVYIGVDKPGSEPYRGFFSRLKIRP